MDNLELLSDDDLRIRLLQYGFENLPITQTTRKTLIKKLRNHLNSTNSHLRKTASLATRYSSGEDSDTVDKVDPIKGRRGRMTTSAGIVNIKNMPPPSLGNRSFPANLNNSISSQSLPNARSSVSSNGNKKGSVYVSPVIINDSEDDNIDWSFKKSRNSKNYNRSSDLNFTGDNSQRTINGSNGYGHDDDFNSTSEYTKRLLQLREGTIQKPVNNNLRKRNPTKLEYLSENDIVFHAEPSLEPASIPLKAAIKSFINRLDTAYGFKQTFVPMLLVSSVIVFFVLIIFMYITISPNIMNILDPSTTLYNACHGDHEMDGSYSCIDETNLEASLDLLKILAPELQTRAIAKLCGDTNTPSPVMCVKDIKLFLSNNQAYNDEQNHQSHRFDLIRTVHNIEYLIDKNKQWGIQNCNAQGDFLTMDKVMEFRVHQEDCLVISKPKLPITCTIQNKINTFFFIIGSLAIITAIVFIVKKVYQFMLYVKEKRRAQVDDLIREICNMLVEITMHNGDKNYIIVNHLRDKIINPSKQSEMASTWKEAISYLQQNDSRIHFGVEQINGEDLNVIRWVEDSKSASKVSPQQVNQPKVLAKLQPTPSHATVKRWRGSAFDHSNRIKDPPTNCLKIRQMFDKYEITNPNLQTIIQDTILHKLKDKNCKVYDIQLDMKTCCVYMKCASCADAGTVHEEINGWWLDSGLVIVKFLKQDKYHQRFPSSMNACTPLHPSSNMYVTQSDTNGQEDFFDDDIDEEDFE